jgi:hypothetical protein
MNANEFETALAAALGLCRAAAAAKLPIEAMLTFAYDAQELPLAAGPDEWAAIAVVIEAVGDVAAIGERLPPEPTPIRVPNAPDRPGVPMPTNLTA